MKKGGKPPRFTMKESESLFNRYSRGTKVADLAKEFDCSKTCIRKHMLNYVYKNNLVDEYFDFVQRKLKNDKRFHLWDYVRYDK